MFFSSAYFGLKCCPSVLDVTGIRGLSRIFRNSSLFTVTCKNTPSSRRDSAAKYLCKDVDVPTKATDSLKQNLCYCVIFLRQLKYVSRGLGRFIPSIFFILFLWPYCFCLVSVLSLCICTVFALYLCLCVGCTCAVKPAR
jgi:hypothetical protein